MSDIRSFTFEQLDMECKAMGLPAYRTGQIFSWLHKEKADSFDEMTNLSKVLRKDLQNHFELTLISVECIQESAIDGTRKYLFRLQDGEYVESVFMRYHHGNSVCISTQVGCRMGCRFCASTVNGLKRSLLAGEMLEQVYQIEKSTGERVSNIVLMGSGEPMENLTEVLRFIQIISDPRGLNISQRNLTVSTCGLVEMIREFADAKTQVTLALSLHAADQKTREALMPIAKKYELQDVLKACDYYFEKTGRRVSYEYSLVSGVNDTKEEADKLIRLFHGKNAHVNLIPVNPVVERSFEKPTDESVLAFQKSLVKGGINATIRRSMGKDIDGACGQLRNRRLNAEKGET